MTWLQGSIRLSIIPKSNWKDGSWRARRKNLVLRNDLVIYEVHAGSWKQKNDDHSSIPSKTTKRRIRFRYLVRWTTHPRGIWCQWWPIHWVWVGLSAHGYFCTRVKLMVVQKSFKISLKNATNNIEYRGFGTRHFITLSMMMPWVYYDGTPTFEYQQDEHRSS